MQHTLRDIMLRDVLKGGVGKKQGKIQIIKEIGCEGFRVVKKLT